MNKILVLNGPYNAKAVENLGEIKVNPLDFIENPTEYKLVLFTGGSDVHPAFYGHTSPTGLCSSDVKRDVAEQEIFNLALENRIPMTGICRGSQFLNVMSGGTLIHHLSNHLGYHKMITHSGKSIQVNSTHHQMSTPSKEGFILGWSERLSNQYFGDKDLKIDYEGPEVESIYYPKNKIFAVQYHPEMLESDSEGHKWFKEGVLDLMTLTEQEFKEKYISKEEQTLSLSN